MPVMSDGIRSGVNWMRLNDSDRSWAMLAIISVLASPGTPSRMQCPWQNRAIITCLSTSVWPTMTRPSCSVIWS